MVYQAFLELYTFRSPIRSAFFGLFGSPFWLEVSQGEGGGTLGKPEDSGREDWGNLRED